MTPPRPGSPTNRNQSPHSGQRRRGGSQLFYWKALRSHYRWKITTAGYSKSQYRTATLKVFSVRLVLGHPVRYFKHWTWQQWPARRGNLKRWVPSRGRDIARRALALSTRKVFCVLTADGRPIDGSDDMDRLVGWTLTASQCSTRCYLLTYSRFPPLQLPLHAGLFAEVSVSVSVKKQAEAQRRR